MWLNVLKHTYTFYKGSHWVSMSIGLCDISLINVYLMFGLVQFCSVDTKPANLTNCAGE